jgi:DNA ligase-1
MLFADVVAASGRVAATSSRLSKIRELADCLRSAGPDEVPVAIAFLSGQPRQGKLGVALATLQAAQNTPPASVAALTLSGFALWAASGSVERDTEA